MRPLSFTLGLLALAGCGPELRVQRYAVEIAAVERCERVGSGAEVCEEPEAVIDTIPVVLETLDSGEVTLFAGDPETDLDRAYFGTQRGDQLTLRRQLRQLDEQADCSFEQTSDLALRWSDEALEGSERALLSETAGCNSLGTERVTRTDLRWSGTRVDDGV